MFMGNCLQTDYLKEVSFHSPPYKKKAHKYKNEADRNFKSLPDMNIGLKEKEAK